MSFSSMRTDSFREMQDDSLMAKVRRLDFYGGPKAEFKKGTYHGVFLTLIVISLASILIAREFQYSWQIRRISSLQVYSDFTPSGRKIKFTFDIKFPAINCKDISISAEDHNGAPQENVVYKIKKFPLDNKGSAISDGYYEKIGDTAKNEASLVGEKSEITAQMMLKEKGAGVLSKKGIDCGDCFGAGETSDCCNTCDEVKEKFRLKGWDFVQNDIPQCHERWIKLSEMIGQEKANERENEPKEGCSLSGYVELSKARGNVHFAPKSQGSGSEPSDPLSIIESTFQKFNTTHLIEVLRFGEDVPGIIYPLESTTRTVRDVYGMYSYFVKIVPTTFKPMYGESVTTNQYSVTEHLKHVDVGTGRGLPGIYFNYEVSTITAFIEETRVGLLKFFTSVCAIVGGLYTVIGLFDHLIGSFERKRV